MPTKKPEQAAAMAASIGVAKETAAKVLDAFAAGGKAYVSGVPGLKGARRLRPRSLAKPVSTPRQPSRRQAFAR
jgi:hypothetical protein